MRMIKEREFDEILREFVRGRKVKVFVFGSRARGDNSPVSDIDLGVFFESGAPDERFAISLLRERFENSNIPQKVDVVNLNEVPDEFKRQILKEAVLWKAD